MEDFLVVEKIGQGSYATVYKSQRKTTNVKEYVAIKVVQTNKLSSRGKEDILTEIKMLKMLKHRNIVEMIDFKWDNRNIYIIMEFCDGGDLSSFIKTRRRLAEQTCRKFLQQLALGLQFLRSHNISHFDLKPQNLLIVTKPKVTLKIGDFGFAQFLNDASQKSSIRGSPLYMAPEMLLDGKYDAKADLWSVGVITYECLFGKAPYSSDSYTELYNKIKLKVPIELPRSVDLSENCRNFVTSLLIHDPEKRMNYDAFLSHPFLELQFVPSDENYEKALRLFKEAGNLESSAQYIEAFNKYCQGLRYMFPIFEEEINEEKKTQLRAKLTHFASRAEKLGCSLSIDLTNRKDISKLCPPPLPKTKTSLLPVSYEHNCDSKETPMHSRNDHTALKQLLSLCSSTPNLLTGIEIGITAQMYLAEGKYQLALEKFQSSLSILLPMSRTELHGRRRDLLYSQIEAWMQQAESAKSLLSIQNNTESQSSTSAVKESCSIQ